jgi:hypothetical protein
VLKLNPKCLIFALLVFCLAADAVSAAPLIERGKIVLSKSMTKKRRLLKRAPAPAERASNFSLEDQFGEKTDVRFPSDKPVVLVFGDREGSEQVEGWVRPLYNKFTDRVYIFGIAELSAVPWAVRPVVRRIIRSKSKTPVMLDWTGKIAKSYNCEKGKANVFAINRNGEIIAVRRGKANAAAINEIVASLEKSFYQLLS